MFRRPSKKQLLIRRVIVSVVMVLAVLVIVTGTILFVLGYRLDSDKGRLEQTALLQFDSTPSGAYITIDGNVIGSRTAAKQSVIAGSHSFIVSHDGYEQWAKSLDVNAGTLEWLDYIRLVPKNLSSETVSTYSSVYGEKASPDFKWLIVQEKSNTPSFTKVDLRSQDIKNSTLTLPSSVYSEATTKDVKHTFMLYAWDSGGRYVLLKHTYDKKSEWIVMDTEDTATSVNVTTLLSLSLTDVKFSGTSGNILYGLASDGVIRKLDLNAGTISRGLVTNVKKFNLFETNIITYVGIDPSDSTKQVAGVYREGDENPHVLRTIDSLKTSVSIDASRYFSDDLVAIAEGLRVTVFKGKYPTSSSDQVSSLKDYADFTVSSDVDQLTFSHEGDYLVVRSGLGFVSFEVEYKRTTSAEVETSEKTSHNLNWLDDAYVWSIYDGHLSIREFDGTNVHVIAAAEPSFDATLSQNGRYLYSITKSGAQYQLQRVKMILD